MALPLLASLSLATASDHWAVLIAGSSGYGNYRHQADVCHAYQTVIKKGIPAEHVIVMAVDDIASSGENPFPGKMFNKPTPAGTPGIDVYAGCKIDWSGRDVTPENLVKVLTGDNSTSGEAGASAGKAHCTSKQTQACQNQHETCCCTHHFLFGCQQSVCCAEGFVCAGRSGCTKPGPPPPAPSRRVLGSTSNSKVFVNFVDHGGVGIIGFPRTTMHATELAAALKTMAAKKMYKELVFYLEACESGSMFPAGSLQPGMYATTAANARESSWGTYCSPDDKVDGKDIGSCLGDLYSVTWMEDSDKDGGSETLEQQFEKVKRLVNKSHVQEFGDHTLTTEPIADFQGDAGSLKRRGLSAPTRAAELAPAAAAIEDSRDAEVASAYHRFMATGSDVAAEELVAYVRDRATATRRFAAIATALGVRELSALPAPEPIDYECHYAAHKEYVSSCGEWTTGAYKHSATLAKLCASTQGDAAPIRAAIQVACASED